MRIYVDNKTNEICLLSFINSYSGKFTMEYEDGEMTVILKKSVWVDEYIRNNFTEIGYLD